MVHGVAASFVAPFEGVFPNAQKRSVLDLAALLAMIVNGLLAWGIVRGVGVVQRRRSPFADLGLTPWLAPPVGSGR